MVLRCPPFFVAEKRPKDVAIGDAPDRGGDIVTTMWSSPLRHAAPVLGKRGGDEVATTMTTTTLEEAILDAWKPLATLAREAGVPEASARRYADAFQALVRSRRMGKAVLYAPEVAEILKLAADGFANGQRRDEIAEILATRFGRVHEVATGGESSANRQTVATTATPSGVQAADIHAILAVLAPLADRFVGALEKAAEALVVIAGQKATEADMRPVQASRPETRPNGHPKVQTPGESPPTASFSSPPRSRAEIVAEVKRLHAAGLGGRAIATVMRRDGWPTLSGRGSWAAGVVKRILKGEAKS